MKLVESEAMNDFIGSLDLLNEANLMVLVASWGAVAQRDHEAAWAEVRRVATDDGLDADVKAVRDRAMQWAYRGTNIPAIPYSMMSDDEWLRLRREAAPALVDAALAVALGDRLGQSARNVLLAPWLRATQV